MKSVGIAALHEMTRQCVADFVTLTSRGPNANIIYCLKVERVIVLLSTMFFLIMQLNKMQLNQTYVNIRKYAGIVDT